jgi:hypothetical protein
MTHQWPLGQMRRVLPNSVEKGLRRILLEGRQPAPLAAGNQAVELRDAGDWFKRAAPPRVTLRTHRGIDAPALPVGRASFGFLDEATVRQGHPLLGAVADDEVIVQAEVEEFGGLGELPGETEIFSRRRGVA